MNWVINDNIIFKPGKKQLTSLNSPDLNVTLTSPANRCLTLLLEASPEIVLQQDFFSKVWEEEGMLVPTNTLYQNISIVRRGLRAVGQSDALIIATVPRKGFQIDHSVKITSIPEAPFSEPTEMSDIIHSQSNNHFPELLDSKENSLPKPGLPSSVKAKNHQYDLTWLIASLSLALITILISALLVFYSKHMKVEKSFFANYTINEIEGECHYYSKDDSHDDNFNYKKFKEMIKKTGLSCKKYPWIYFQAWTSAPTSTALACRKEYYTTDYPGCISLYFMDINHE